MSALRTCLVALLLCACGGPFAQEAPGERVARLMAVLKSDANIQQKTEACLELGRLGGADAVPVLAALLTDENLSHAARFGLELCESPAADEALRAALGRLTGVLRIGAIDSLGARRDPKAVEALTGLSKNADPETAQAAARALGSIATEEAAKGLQTAWAGAHGAQQRAVCEGLFRCAEALAAQGRADKALPIYDALRALPQAGHPVRTGAWRGAILLRRDDGFPLLMQALRDPDWGLVLAGARIALEVQEAGVEKRLADELAKLPADRQVLVAGILGQRREAAARPALVALARAGEPAARIAALKAAAEIGGDGLAATFIDLLGDPEPKVAQAAHGLLGGLAGAGVDEAVMKALETPDPALKTRLAGLAAQRRIVKALPVLAGLMDAVDECLRLAAIRSFGELAGVAELPVLLARLERCTRAGEIEAYEKAIRTICVAGQDPKAWASKFAESMGRSAPEAKPAFLNLLSVAGGDVALAAVRAALGDASPDVRLAALRVLGEWKSAEAGPVLLELARNSTEAPSRILALRGCLGLALQPQISPEAKLAICREAAPLIERPEEKRLLLAAVSGIGDPRALEPIVPYLDDAGVRQETVMAILAVAEKREKKRYPAETKAALEKALKAASEKPDAAKRIEKLLAQIAAEP